MISMKLTDRNYLPFIILIEGFVSISVEILTIRQLLPVAGNSVIITSLVIGIFLLFLALGYKKGGAVTKDLKNCLRNNFLKAALWLGVGLSTFFVTLFFYAMEKMTLHIAIPVMTYLMLIIAPLIYVLGQTVPITMNMIQQDKSVGMIGGDTLGLSTIGSFLGATFTALVLMHFLGVAWTVFLNFALLMGLFLLLTEKRSHTLSIIMMSFVTIFIYVMNIKFDKDVFILSNNYGNYQIIDVGQSKEEKVLIINNSYSSYINSEKKGFPYIEEIKKILFQDMKLKNANILVLGAGGFSLSAENDFKNNITYVDIDQNIKKAVVPEFLKEIKGKLVADDARHYIHMIDKKYEVIICDAYTGLKSIPSHLVTKEYMYDIKNKLTSNGVAILNIIAHADLSDAYSKRMDNTIRSVFANCTVTPMKYGHTVANMVYVCNKNQTQVDKTIYSDNLNNASTDYFEW